MSPLPVAANLSTTVRVHPLFAHQVTPPFVLHYHNEIDDRGFVFRSRNRPLNPLIDACNRARAQALGVDYGGLPAPPLVRRALREVEGHGWYEQGPLAARASPPAARPRPPPGQAPRPRMSERTMSTGVARPAGPTPRPSFPFFVGCGRSGTTLLRAIFDSHPDLRRPGRGVVRDPPGPAPLRRSATGGRAATTPPAAPP